MQSSSAIAFALLAASLAAQGGVTRRPQWDGLLANSARRGLESTPARRLVCGGAEAARFLGKAVGAVDRDRAERVCAVQLLMRMGPGAEPAIDGLLAPLHQGDLEITVHVVVALGAVAPFFAEARNRERALGGILSCVAGPRRIEKLPPMFPARAISRLQVPADATVDRLIELVQSKNPYQIEFACQLLIERGMAARRAVPHLTEALRKPRFPAMGSISVHDPTGAVVPLSDRTDWSAHVRQALHQALLNLAPDRPAAMGVHWTRLQDEDPDVVLQAVMALGRLGADASPAVPRLIDILQRGELAVVRETVTALGMIGPPAAQAVPLLRRLERSEDGQTAARARAALRQIADG